MTGLANHLAAAGRGGRKLLVPYVMAGIPEPAQFEEAARAVGEHADALEIGIPYSDPLMDGPVIAAAAARSIATGVGPSAALDLVGALDRGPPRVVMTYYNPVHRIGEDVFCARLARANVAGIIVPDLPVEEADELTDAAARNDLAWIPLVSPTSSPERAERIARTATGFVYAVSTLGVTGTREELSRRAASVAEACREGARVPVLVGIGISTPEQARAAVAHADGVVIGSAVVERIIEQGVDRAGKFLAEVRAALDS
ncbi:MAG: tryptophan synthase subunit alpha [Actinomycetota bacterium]|nr:tryptophan synthase subunit alpha [Actinomycetota bacterium]